MSDPKEPEEVVVLCMPLGSSPIASGSMQRPCSKCARTVTISRATLIAATEQADKEGTEITLVCLHCAPEHIPKDQELMPITEGQRREVLEELKRLREKDE